MTDSVDGASNLNSSEVIEDKKEEDLKETIPKTRITSTIFKSILDPTVPNPQE